MQQISRSQLISAGLAMFCMFFGAGNIVYPLAIGQYAQDKNIFALLGMLITAVCIPFLGVIAMILFDGNHIGFFGRLGKIPSFIIIGVIMALLGPFGAIPRCIALSYSTVSTYISLPLFSALSCLFIFVFTIKRSSVVDVLGYFFTPFLLLSLGVIIIKGLMYADIAPVSPIDNSTAFLHGLRQGYQTMDLLGAFFFSTVVLVGLKASFKNETESEPAEIVDTDAEEQEDMPLDPALQKQVLKAGIQASWIGAFLLSIIYVGFSFVAALHSKHLDNVLPQDLINQIAYFVLGGNQGFIVAVAVSLACITTAMALSVVFADYLKEDLSNSRIGYVPCLVATLVIAGLISLMDFNAIITMLAPVLELFYPALMMLCVVNILYKLYGFKPVKVPVFTVFFLSVANTLL